MSVTAGRFSGSAISYAAGAPRSNGTGQVVVFTKGRTADSRMRVQLILSGQQFASSYGYQVDSADLNGDGWVFLFFSLTPLAPPPFPGVFSS